MVKFTSDTRQSFIRSAKITKGKYLMIPYYYRRKYGNRGLSLRKFKGVKKL